MRRFYDWFSAGLSYKILCLVLHKKQLPLFFYGDTEDTKAIVNFLKDVLTTDEHTFFTYLLKDDSQLEISKKVNKGYSQVGRKSLKIELKIRVYLYERGLI